VSLSSDLAVALANFASSSHCVVMI
jgi:hypothetical protein